MPQRRRQRSQVLQSGCQRLHSEMRLHSEPKRTTRREEDNSLAISICPQCFRICLRYHRMDDAKDYRISKLFQLCQKQKSFRCAKHTVWNLFLLRDEWTFGSTLGRRSIVGRAVESVCSHVISCQNQYVSSFTARAHVPLRSEIAIRQVSQSSSRCDVNKHIAPFLFCMQVTYSRPSIALPTDSYVVCGEGPKPLDQTVLGTVAGWVRYLSQQRTELLESLFSSFLISFAPKEEDNRQGTWPWRPKLPTTDCPRLRAQIIICDVAALLLRI